MRGGPDVAQLSSGYQLVLMPAELTTGRLALTMVVRRTYRIDQANVVLQPLPDADQPPPLAEDRYDAGDPTTVPPTLETDLVPEKARVDVLVLGKAYAPGGKALAEFECAVQVGKKRETLRILGPRRAMWQPLRKQDGVMRPQPPRFTEPEPVKEVPLSLTLAYGGWSWLVPDDEALRIQREVAKVMAEEAAVNAAAVAPKAPKQDEKTPKVAAQAADKPGEKLRLGDGSEGFDADGVRLWNAAASNDGTAVLSVDEFERQELAKQARALRKGDEPKGEIRSLRQNAAGEWLEHDDGAELMTDAALAEMRAEKARDEAKQPREAQGEVVLNADGARVLGDGESADWDAKLRGEIAEDDAKTAGARHTAEAERRKAEDAALAEFPRMPCPTNPFGVGFCISNHPKVLARTQLPQIEDPLTPLTPGDFIRDYQRLDAVPLPAGVGVLPRHARPRIDLAGPLPSSLGDWQEKRDAEKKQIDLGTREGVQTLRALEAREKPRQMQAGYYNCALPALQMSELRGDEEVLLENLTKDGRLFFKLPARAPVAELDRGRGVERKDLRLDTLVIDAEKAEVSLVWRAQFAFATWEELETYPHLVGHVLDWDASERRKRDDAEAARKARGDGTQILDLNDLPAEEPEGAAVVKSAATPDALELPKMGSYVQAADDGWAQRADEAAAESAARREKEQAELAWRAQSQTALKHLAAQEQAENARRVEIAAAVAAGKPVPPPGGKAK
jgi:hypothetical protein